MVIRYLMVGAAALAIAGLAGAEPTKPEAQGTTKAPSQPAGLVMASAEQVPTPAIAEQAQPTTPAKRPRAARVTSCRCGAQANPDQ